MKKLINIITWPFYLIALIIAGIIIICHEEKEYKAMVKASKCKHVNQTDVTVDATVTCETIHTICDDCCKVLNQRTECT